MPWRDNEIYLNNAPARNGYFVGTKTLHRLMRRFFRIHLFKTPVVPACQGQVPSFKILIYSAYEKIRLRFLPVISLINPMPARLLRTVLIVGMDNPEVFAIEVADAIGFS